MFKWWVWKSLSLFLVVHQASSVTNDVAVRRNRHLSQEKRIQAWSPHQPSHNSHMLWKVIFTYSVYFYSFAVWCHSEYSNMYCITLLMTLGIKCVTLHLPKTFSLDECVHETLLFVRVACLCWILLVQRIEGEVFWCFTLVLFFFYFIFVLATLKPMQLPRWNSLSL